MSFPSPDEQAKAKKAADIEHNFTYHAPRPDMQRSFVTIRDTAKELALTVLDLTPLSREQSLALTHLEEAVFWANAALARHG